MLTNADITIFNCWHKGTRSEAWKHTQIRGVEWYGGQATTLLESGLKSADTYTVRIPISADAQGKAFAMAADYAAAGETAVAGLWTLQNGDVVVHGLVDDTPAGDTDITSKCSDRCFTVTGWRDNRRGGPLVQHWRISGA